MINNNFKGGEKMEVKMSADEVISGIQHLKDSGGSLNKKTIKKTHPELLRHALHYFPDWNSAIDKSSNM